MYHVERASFPTSNKIRPPNCGDCASGSFWAHFFGLTALKLLLVEVGPIRAANDKFGRSLSLGWLNIPEVPFLGKLPE